MAYAKTNMDTASIFWDEKLCPTISLIHSSSKKLEKYGKKFREKERQPKSKHKDKWKSKYEWVVDNISKEIMKLIEIYNGLNKEDEAGFQRNSRTQSFNPSKRFNRHEYEEKVKTLQENVRQLNADNRDLLQSNCSIRHECEENVRKLQETIRELKEGKWDQQTSFEEQLQNFQTNEPKEGFYRRNPSYQSDPPSKRFNRHEYEEKVKTLEEIVRQLNADNQDLQSRVKSLQSQMKKEEQRDHRSSLEAQFKTNEPEESLERRNRSRQSDPPSKRFNKHEYEEKIKRLEETVRQLNAVNQDLQTRSKKKITQLEEEKLDLQTRTSLAGN